MSPTTPAPATDAAAARLAALLQWYGTLSPSTLPRLAEYYRSDARFKDPFNEVQGPAAIAGIFEHMFATTQTPCFMIRDALSGPGRAYILWDFDFGWRGRRYRIRGTSRLELDGAGLVVEHRDYWDAAEELWQKLPLIGGPVGWLRRRFRAAAPR